jgi:co-chaperonin GroES (HSP10)
VEIDPKKWKPINGAVVLQDDPKVLESKGGIVLPDTADQDTRVVHGTVLATAPFLLESGKWMDPPFSAGDRVVYTQHAAAGATVKEGDTFYRLARWNEVLAVVR